MIRQHSYYDHIPWPIKILVQYLLSVNIFRFICLVTTEAFNVLPLTIQRITEIQKYAPICVLSDAYMRVL